MYDTAAKAPHQYRGGGSLRVKDKIMSAGVTPLAKYKLVFLGVGHARMHPFPPRLDPFHDAIPGASTRTLRPRRLLCFDAVGPEPRGAWCGERRGASEVEPACVRRI